MEAESGAVPARWWTRWLGWLNIWKWLVMLAGLIAVGWMGRKAVASRQAAKDLEHVAKQTRREAEAEQSGRAAQEYNGQAEIAQQAAEAHVAKADSLQAGIEDRQARIDRLRKELGL